MEDIENFDNFDSWNNIKKDMHQNKNRVHFRQKNGVRHYLGNKT